MKTAEDFRIGNLQLLKSDLNHVNVTLISRKLGPYNYEACMPFAKIAFVGSPYAEAPLKKLSVTEVEKGILYEGEWVKELLLKVRMGRGVQLWPDGSRYEGFWREGKACGPGRLIHANGDCYEGIWREG